MLPIMKTDERRRARDLRAKGWSVKDIHLELGVSRSSVSVWVRDVPLTEAQRAALAQRVRLGPLVAGERSANAAREARRRHQDEGRRLARERGPRYEGGCMLYWAEGAKSRNRVKITNSDAGLLAYFANFLRREFDVRSEDMRVYCNLFADHADRQREIESFWLERLGLPPPCLRKSVVNVYSKYSQKKRQGKLPHGTCALVVQSTRIVQTIYGSIQEYGGFDRPEWLD
jgi:transcriptional regulator with XRE-family HTH domain